MCGGGNIAGNILIARCRKGFRLKNAFAKEVFAKISDRVH